MGKLRNKKTGEIVDLSIFGITLNIRKEEQPTYHSIEGVCEDWEDVEEPLIKDEKICKAIRAWAEANGYDTVLYDKDKDCIYSPYGSDKTDTSVSISFDLDGTFKELEHRHLYTITELCGEEAE